MSDNKNSTSAPRSIINESGYKPVTSGPKNPPTAKPQASNGDSGGPQAAKK